ncbi:D-amino-acid transaminase [Pararhizobium haloflavum]|uniref:D-amino-acid transaminase n=1 Tax=Pararhizobium haloflavum TaxID=2037914 RepID=UPI000C183E5B|nr:D-amino-acid transaminase [Pararhizobium haloflavum]
MSRIAYVNGRYRPLAQAAIHVEDRGYQFADGVYEVCEIRHGYIMDMTRHLDRLDRSLRELDIAWPMERRALEMVLREVVRRNKVRNGIVYWQVTRGVARRDHVFPAEDTAPAIVVTAKKINPATLIKKNETGIKAITLPENRWERVDIKTVGLLPNVLARQKAKLAGAQEAFFVDENGMVKEGAATNVWIVTADKTLVTRPADFGILRGITRTTVIDVADKLGLKVEERPFSVDEAKAAREVFISAASSVAIPVVSIDGATIANGHPGHVCGELRDAFFDVAEKTPT